MKESCVSTFIARARHRRILNVLSVTCWTVGLLVCFTAIVLLFATNFTLNPYIASALFGSSLLLLLVPSYYQKWVKLPEYPRKCKVIEVIAGNQGTFWYLQDNQDVLIIEPRELEFLRDQMKVCMKAEKKAVKLFAQTSFIVSAGLKLVTFHCALGTTLDAGAIKELLALNPDIPEDLHKALADRCGMATKGVCRNNKTASNETIASLIRKALPSMIYGYRITDIKPL